MRPFNLLYTPRTPLEDDGLFKNYGVELAEIEGDFQRPGAAYALVGGPGMAKSSILRRIRRDLLKRLTLSAPSPDQLALVPVYIKLSAPLELEEPRRLRALLGRMMQAALVDLQGTISALNFDASRLRISRAPESGTTENDHKDFFNDLWEIVMEVERVVGPAKLVLLLDGLEGLVPDRPLRVAFARLLLEFVDSDSMNSRKSPRSYAAVVLACDRDLPEVLPTQHGKALGAFIKPRYLSTLDRESSFSLIQEPLREEAGIEVPPEVVEEVHVQTGGHPCLIHSVMQDLCERGDPRSITRERVRETIPSVVDSMIDIAEAIQSYVEEDSLANLVFATIYQKRLPLLLEQIVESLPAEFHGSRAFRVQKTLKMLAALGVVRIINDDRSKRYEGTGEIFRAWFGTPPPPRAPGKQLPLHASLRVSHMSIKREVAQNFRGKVDFGIITIRVDEYQAFLDRLPTEFFVEGRQTYSVSRLKTIDDNEYVIALIRCPEQGNATSQTVAHNLIEDLDPQWLVVAGIAGSVPETEHTLGDVLVATRLQDFSVSASIEDSRGQSSREFDMRGGPMHPAVQSLVAAIPAIEPHLERWNTSEKLSVERPEVIITPTNFYGSKAWKNKVKVAIERYFGAHTDRREPIVFTGSVASSDVLVKDSGLVRQWLSNSRQIHGIEMELTGVYQAAWNAQKPVLAVRGISDIVGFKRSAEWTSYACHAAASFLIALLQGYPPIIPTAKTPSGEIYGENIHGSP